VAVVAGYALVVTVSELEAATDLGACTKLMEITQPEPVARRRKAFGFGILAVVGLQAILEPILARSGIDAIGSV
jgi:hypothetical protein